jgi:hypothetical protein
MVINKFFSQRIRQEWNTDPDPAPAQPTVLHVFRQPIFTGQRTNKVIVSALDVMVIGLESLRWGETN